LPPTKSFIFYFSLMTDAYETTICCRALLVTVLVRPNFYSARPQASRQLNPALRQLSEIGGIVNLVDRRRSSISRSERPPCRAKSITRFDDGYDEAKFSSPEFVTKFQREVPVFLEIPGLPFNTV